MKKVKTLSEKEEPMSDVRGSIYNLTLAEAECCIGVLAKVIREKDIEIKTLDASEVRLLAVIDMKDRIV